ncbi:hypothetical protein [Ottowia caeni]|uniref:hypothetical protein n=1 Tax=Ottowia caeni TaxID=2870339 RepID=UPI003D715953
MNTRFLCSDNAHPLGEIATHPIRPPSVTLAALLPLQGATQPEAEHVRAVQRRAGAFGAAALTLAGTSLPRPRVLPAHPMTTCSGASNWI